MISLDNAVAIKTCRKCGMAKPLADFHSDRKRRDGKYPNCRACHGAHMRARYAENPAVKQLRIARYAIRRVDPAFRAASKRRSEKHYGSIEGRAKSLLRCAKRSPDGCSLTLDEVRNLLTETGRCPVTGIPFDFGPAKKGYAKNPYAPSLDRIDPASSYSLANVRVVIWQYNMMKGELSDAEVALICRKVIENA
jgi:hypothetical protein